MPKILLNIFLFFNFFWVLNLNAETLYPYWLKYGLQVTVDFGTQQEVGGYGIIINDGLILTSAQNVYQNHKAENILLHNTESLGDPVACLGYARVLALDTNLDLAVLEVSTFTDIYCNILPERNFRSLIFKESFLNLLEDAQDFPLEENTNISYFIMGNWLEFQRKTISLGAFISLLQIQKRNFLGMPIFVKRKDSLSEDIFVGIITAKPYTTILKAKEIVQFLCQTNKKTSVFKKYPSLQSYCD